MTTSDGDTGSRFEVGDEVRVIAKHDEHLWSAGKVVRCDEQGSDVYYCVQLHDDPTLYSYQRADLYPAESLWLGKHAPPKADDSKAPQLAPGWYPAAGGQRYWNGDEWTGQAAAKSGGAGGLSILGRTVVGLVAALAVFWAAHACTAARDSQNDQNSAPATTETVSPCWASLLGTGGPLTVVTVVTVAL